jgi:SAM-dependent methyltransferase
VAEPDPPLAGLDLRVPNVARVYDYLLGGKDNFAVDREAAEELLTIMPEMGPGARMYRMMLARMVHFITEAGIRQFVDIGAGLPTQDSVHQIAHRTAPDTRVVYVDNDPVVVLHGQALLEGNDRVRAVQGDLRRPEEILAHPDVCDLIDFDEPVGILLISIMHFIGAEVEEIMAQLRDMMVPGSYLAISQFTGGDRTQATSEVKKLASRGGTSLVPRTREEILQLFEGFALVPCGDTTEWNTQPDKSVAPLGLAFVGCRV